MAWRFCPHCGRELQQDDKSAILDEIAAAPAPSSKVPQAVVYDQTAHWRALVREAERVVGVPTPEELIARIKRPPTVSTGDLLASIVHLILDRDSTPTGGALFETVRSSGSAALDLERLALQGYEIENDKVKQVEGTPIGRAYSALDYWGGVRQHRRWHLVEPIEINPSRHGDPFFMDGPQVAFGAKWRDLERLGEAVAGLVDAFDRTAAGRILIADIYWLR